jgi:hypothetical protein
MDFVIDNYLSNDNYDEIAIPPSFIYDDNRYYSKLYIFLKLLGLITYASTLLTCYNPDFYIMMIVFMFLSIMNSVRYEYQHYKRHGTIFLSMDEFKEWKKELWPNTKVVFYIIELGIKAWFFKKTFPQHFDFNNLCDIGDSIFKIHILGFFAMYSIFAILCICLVSTSWCYTSSYYRPSIRQNENNSLPNTNPIFIPVTIPRSILVTNNQEDECCICLDNNNNDNDNNNQVWSMLPCGHKFHESCISSWLHRQQRCPVCRYSMVNVS